MLRNIFLQIRVNDSDFYDPIKELRKKQKKDNYAGKSYHLKYIIKRLLVNHNNSFKLYKYPSLWLN